MCRHRAPHSYAKQLAAHLGRIETTWDEESGHGRLVFPHSTGTLTAIPGTLLLPVEGDASHLAGLEDVLARHPVGFDTKDELLVHWQRNPASATTTPHQQAHTPPSDHQHQHSGARP
ncbi:DUF2218 domain-containing protein [Streptomyces kronopolitis]|uniref:DUF2218 domain-containing protein n=1 Tax=Streptomyces kronopolitis TaxID=1612435 RepID=UPI00342D65C6